MAWAASATLLVGAVRAVMGRARDGLDGIEIQEGEEEETVGRLGILMPCAEKGCSACRSSRNI